MADTLRSCLQINLGDHRAVKLTYLMVDGSAVNQVARQHAEGHLRKIYDRIHPVPERDLQNFQEHLLLGFPGISLLSCIGHMLNNVCKTSLESYEDTPVFEFKKHFARAFFSGGKASAMKGKYKGQVLDTLLGKFDEKVVIAESTLKQCYRGLGENSPTRYKEALEIKICESLTALEKVIPLDSCSLLCRLKASNLSWTDKHNILLEIPIIVSALRDAGARRAVSTPKLGGVTRWCEDKFTCMSFLYTDLDYVAAFIFSEIAKRRHVSASIRRCHQLLLEHGAEALKCQSREFLDKSNVLHLALRKFSDMMHKPMATQVAQTLELYEHACSGEGPDGLDIAMRHHMRRLNKNHNMDFWKDVVWFRPAFILQYARPCGLQPISLARANNLFDENAGTPKALRPLFNISEQEWEEWGSCVAFRWNPEIHEDEDVWWLEIGSEMFPAIFRAAMHYIWTPPLVTKCDSWLSILSYMYNSRQTRTSPQVVANRIFIRGNQEKLEYLIPGGDEESDTDESVDITDNEG